MDKPKGLHVPHIDFDTPTGNEQMPSRIPVGICSSGCPRPPEPWYPWYARLSACVITWASWPWYVRQLKRQGFVRLGWMTWGPRPIAPDEEAEPDCD